MIKSNLAAAGIFFFGAVDKVDYYLSPEARRGATYGR